MKTRSAGQVLRIGVAFLAFSLAFLAGAAATASDVERQIPLIRDAAGSGLTMEISGEGNRRTATPFITLNNPTAQRIEDRIAKKTSRSAVIEIPAVTPREGSARQETTLSSASTVPEEITLRSVRGILKGMRASRKEKPAPAAVAPAPELRLGRTDTPPSETN
jgi:hypothetical protein